MAISRSFRNAWIFSILLHVSLAIMLMMESTSDRPVLTKASQTSASLSQPINVQQPQVEPIKAVSVDSQEVMKTVNRLKDERLHQQQAEQNRQRALTQQADAARQRRIEEQLHLEKLKTEAAKLAKAHEQQLAEEQLHLKKVAKQKEEEERHLAVLKKQQEQLQKQQQQEAEKLAELKKKRADDLARANQAKEAKAKEELAQKQQAAMQQAALDAQKNAQIAGEVNKYKAMITAAISRQWILPENANRSLSSQFRIRLAPNGIVLEVSLTRSSGDPILDRSAQSAIYKASPLPVPSDPDTFNMFRDINLTVRPENARG